LKLNKTAQQNLFNLQASTVDRRGRCSNRSIRNYIYL